MSDLDAYCRIQFVDSLIGYLDVRQWSFAKIRTCPASSTLIDLRMHHYLYFTNLFGSIDLVRDHLDESARSAFNEELQKGFPSGGDYLYARELRNAMVHRGLDPVASAAQHGDFVYAGCPPVVFHRGGKKAYACSTPLLASLAVNCNKASNAAILRIVEHEGLLDPGAYRMDMTQPMDAVEATECMPEWAEDMAAEAFVAMDLAALSAELGETRVRQLQSLLGDSA